MYCTNCGHKLDINNNYCTNCGHKINNNNNLNPNKKNNNIPLIIGIISIIGSFIINIIILPIAIFGIILSIKSQKKTELFINIIACIIAIIIFSTITFITIKSYNYIKDNYKDNYKYHKKYDYHNDDNYNDKKINITGTWYLYENNKINQNNYYTFNINKTFVYKKDSEVYIGTYDINKNYNNQEDNFSLSNSYILTLNIISLTKNDGTIITDNLDKISYNITLNDDTLEIQNIKTNEYLTFKKNILTTY